MFTCLSPVLFDFPLCHVAFPSLLSVRPVDNCIRCHVGMFCIYKCVYKYTCLCACVLSFFVFIYLYKLFFFLFILVFRDVSDVSVCVWVVEIWLISAFNEIQVKIQYEFVFRLLI